MKKSILAIALLTCSSAALAEGPNWNTASVSYLDTDFATDYGDVGFDGVGLNGSFAFNDNWLVVADYQGISAEENGSELELDFTSVGVGFYKQISETTDFYTTLTSEHMKLSASVYDSSASESESGVGAGLGIRSMLTPSFEVDASVSYLVFDGEGITRSQVNGFYYLTENMAIGLGYELFRPSDTQMDLDTVNASFRITF